MTLRKAIRPAQLLIILSLLLFLAPACNQLPTPTQPPPQATIEITEIVDKTTLQPVPQNTITLRWENAEGELINTEQFQDQTDLVTALPADGKTFLTITIDSPGYVTWSNRFRMKLDEEKTLSMPAELEKGKDIQS